MPHLLSPLALVLKGLLVDGADDVQELCKDLPLAANGEFFRSPLLEAYRSTVLAKQLEEAKDLCRKGADEQLPFEQMGRMLDEASDDAMKAELSFALTFAKLPSVEKTAI